MFFAQACFNDDNVAPDYSKTEVSYISGLGQILYQDGLIKSIGREKMIYDENDLLIASRVYSLDSMYSYDSSSITVYEHLEKYSYIWDNSLIMLILADSLLERVEHVGQLLYNYSLLTNIPVSEQFYTGERLDSIYFYYYIDFEKTNRILLEFDESGNVTKRTEYYTPDIGNPLIPYYPMSITEYTGYDKHPNPYNLIFVKCNTMLNKIVGYNFSANNPTGSILRIKDDDSWLQLEYSFDYIYNSDGLPVTIIKDKGTVNEVITNVEYN